MMVLFTAAWLGHSNGAEEEEVMGIHSLSPSPGAVGEELIGGPPISVIKQEKVDKSKFGADKNPIQIHIFIYHTQNGTLKKRQYYFIYMYIYIG